MIQGEWFSQSHGQIQRSLWLVISPWHHWCNTNPFARNKGWKFVAIDFYSFKYKGYNIYMQIIVDHHKRFQDVFVNVPSSMNDVWILWIFLLHQHVIKGNLFVIKHGPKMIMPYIFGDKGYPFLPWLMVPHKQFNAHHINFETLFD
jgi:hypothetical protein